MLNHRRCECPKLQWKPSNCAKVALKGQRIRDSPFVIQLYVNDQLVDCYRDSGADISLACRKRVRLGIISQIRVSKYRVYRVDLVKFPGEDFCKISPIWNK